jgi:hypothetical protein
MATVMIGSLGALDPDFACLTSRRYSPDELFESISQTADVEGVGEIQGRHQKRKACRFRQALCLGVDCLVGWRSSAFERL